MSHRVVIVAMATALALGCNKAEDQATKYEGRSETKKLQGADTAGYDGTAIRKSVDSSLNKNDQHNETVDRALKADDVQK